LHINEGIRDILLFFQSGTGLNINKCNALAHGSVAFQVFTWDHFKQTTPTSKFLITQKNETKNNILFEETTMGKQFWMNLVIAGFLLRICLICSIASVDFFPRL